MLILAYMSFYKPDKNVVMKKLFLILGILIAQCTINMAQVPTLLPDYPITKGVSAPFAGFIKNWLIVGGGCNFPTIPAAEGGKKAYYNQCYALDIHAASPRWTRISDLPCSVAYGCSVETPQGLVCIGGMNADSGLPVYFGFKKILPLKAFKSTSYLLFLKQ